MRFTLSTAYLVVALSTTANARVSLGHLQLGRS